MTRGAIAAILMFGLAGCASPEADRERARDDALGTATSLTDLLNLRFGDEPDPVTMLAGVRGWLTNPPVEDRRYLGFPTIAMLGHDQDSVEAVVYVLSQPKNTVEAGESAYGRTCQRYTVVDGELSAREIDCPSDLPEDPVGEKDVSP